MGATSHQIHLIPSLPLDAKKHAGIPPDRCSAEETVYLIHEEDGFCQTLATVLASSGMAVNTLSTAAPSLERGKLSNAGCLVLDVHVDMNGAASLHEFVYPELCPPLIVIIDRQDVSLAVRAMKLGAIEVFTKPVDPLLVVEAIHVALLRNRKSQLRKADLELLQARYSLLSLREREVVPYIVGGMLNKQAAALLGISPGTLQAHRGQVMRKMGAQSLADLVRMAVRLRVPYWRGE